MLKLDEITPKTRVTGIEPGVAVRAPFTREPDVGAASVDYTIKELLARAEPPHLA